MALITAWCCYLFIWFSLFYLPATPGGQLNEDREPLTHPLSPVYPSSQSLEQSRHLESLQLMAQYMKAPQRDTVGFGMLCFSSLRMNYSPKWFLFSRIQSVFHPNGTLWNSFSFLRILTWLLLLIIYLPLKRWYLCFLGWLKHGRLVSSMSFGPQWLGEAVLCQGRGTKAGLWNGECQAGFATDELQPMRKVIDPNLVF